MQHNELLMIASVLTAGIACQWLGWRLKLPAILPLLIVGFVAGPVTGLLHPQEDLGALFFPLVSLAVAIILFEGALTLTLDEVRNLQSTVRRLLTVGITVSWFGGALAAYYIMGLKWELALLFGALIIVTGPTVIAPLLRNVRPSHNIASVLKWEGILIDPIGATVAVLIFQFIGAGATAQGTAVTFLSILGVGLILGVGSGYLTTFLLQRFLIPDYLRDVAILAFVALVFAISNTLAPEAGLLSVTVMGIYLANTDLKKLREIWFFKERLSLLLISTLFILLAANITVAELQLLGLPSLLVLFVVLFVLRPMSIWLSTWGSPLTRNERLFLSWIAPRGIVAAAVSSLFTFELVTLYGMEDARVIAPLTFLIIIGTVLLQGSSAKWLAKRLNVSEIDPQGFLLMGANEFGLALAQTLQEEGFSVRIVDTNWGRIAQAKMQGIDADYGNILSDYIEENIDLGGIGHLLALTRNDEANALACKHFEDEFGSPNVYQLAPSASRDAENLGRLQLGRVFMGPEATYEEMFRLLAGGALFKKTPITAQFTYEDFRQQNDNRFIPLMCLQDKTVIIGTADIPLAPTEGWTLLSLIWDTM